MGKILAACVGAAALVGCSTAQVPTEQLAASERMTKAAREGGASKVPAAAFYLQLADDEIGQARQLIGEGKQDRAYNMLVRAEADAELALAAAREGPAKAEAQEAIRRAQQMRSGL